MAAKEVNIHRYWEDFLLPAVGALAWTGEQPFQGNSTSAEPLWLVTEFVVG